LTFADKAYRYFTRLRAPENIPRKFHILNPYDNREVRRVLRIFLDKFYDDSRERFFIIGINHGRFGGGVTGLSFTDPVAVRDFCGIENSLGTRRELSSTFIYKVVEAVGGAKMFFKNFFLTALYPLAVLQDGKNCNYYDDRDLYQSLKPEIINSLRQQIEFGTRRETVVCLGRRNAKFLEQINDQHNFFQEIKVLDHPRWIMQYRLKSVEKYVGEYLSSLSSLVPALNTA